MTIIKTSNIYHIFRRKHDGMLFGNEIVLGLDFSTGIERQDLAEYYEEIRNPELPTPPALLPFACIIPKDLQLPFRNGVFKLNGFEVPLDTIGENRVVNMAYFNWLEFRAELDRKYPDGTFVNQGLKDSLMDLWDFVDAHASSIAPWMQDPVNNTLSEFIIYTP